MKSVFLIDLNDGNDVYHNLVQSAINVLEDQNVHYSKVSVNHILEAPIALRFAVETFRSTSEKHSRKPDGYLVFGFLPHSEHFETVVYEETLRSLQDMACYYGIALSHHTLFETKDESMRIQEIAERTVFSCLNLIQIKKQLGLHTTHISAP